MPSQATLRQKLLDQPLFADKIWKLSPEPWPLSEAQVKDLRTGVETGNIQAVMDGDIDAFINGWLRAGGPRTRNKDIKIED